MPVRWVLFDPNGTLLDPAGIGEPLGLSEDESLAALDEAILATMADTLSGAYRPLPAPCPRRYCGGRSSQALRRESTRRWCSRAECRRTRAPGQAIQGLRAARLEVGALTNSDTNAAEQALKAAGLSQLMALIVGSDQVRVFKPHPDIYRRGLTATGLSRTRCA